MKASTHIMIVDDEETICEALRAWFVKDGYKVETALSGSEALEFLQLTPRGLRRSPPRRVPSPSGADGSGGEERERRCASDRAGRPAGGPAGRGGSYHAPRPPEAPMCRAPTRARST